MLTICVGPGKKALMNSVAQQLMTAEELWQLPDTGVRYELIDGELVETMPPGGIHGAVAVVLSTLLRIWMRQHGRGYIGVEAGFILARDPDKVRGPDVSYVRAERIPVSGIPEGFWTIAPDLAVEVVSPTETAEEIRAKVRDFLRAGTPMVWVIYPRSREVVVHLPDGTARTYHEQAELTAPAILPGFSCTVTELFE